MSRVDQSCGQRLEGRARSLTAALTGTMVAIASPSSFFPTWTALNEAKAGFFVTSTVFALIALLPLSVGALSARHHHNLYRGLTASMVAGVLQLLFIAVLFLFFVAFISHASRH